MRAIRISESITAVTTGGGAFALTGIVAVLNHFGTHFPDWAWLAYGVALTGLASVSIVLTLHIAWVRLRTWGLRMGPLIGLAIGFSIVLGSAIWGFRVWAPQADIATNRVSFQKYAVFWVELDKDIYQLGVVAKFFNVGDEPHLVKGLILTDAANNWSFAPRGGYTIRRIVGNLDSAELLEDNYIKAGSEAYFKKLLPIKIDMTIIGGDTPEFILRGKWTLLLDSQKYEAQTPLYAVFKSVVSHAQWDALLKSQSNIKIDDLVYKRIPKKPPRDAPSLSYLVYNQDRSATIENPYFGQMNRAGFAGGPNS